MMETLRKCPLVRNFMTGKHEDLHVHFEDFANLVKDECLNAESWEEKNAELMTLESTFEIYMEAHPSAAQEVKMLVSKVIDFLRRMRKYFNEYYSQKMQSIRRHFSENHQNGSNEMSDATVATPDAKADIAVVDTVEFIYGSAETFFPELQINDVRERINGSLGTNVSKHQVYANYANIKTRQGVRRSDSDKEKTTASFMQRFANRLHQRITREAAEDDNRSK